MPDPRSPFELSDEEAERLEARLRSEPDDADAREALLAHYSLRAIKSRKAASEDERFVEHARWVVEHRPGSKSAHWTHALLVASRLPEVEQAAIARTWLRHAEEHPEDPDILENAARALTGRDDEGALRLFRAARKLAPDRHALTAAIASILQRQYYRLDPMGPAIAAGVAGENLREIEESLRGDDAYRSAPRELIGELAGAALRAGELDKAEQAAEGMLAHAATGPALWSTGNLHYNGHCILGRVALIRGDVPAACEHLLAAAQTEGSPQLNSFGPNMSLAKELLERGEVEAVIAFFEGCKRFWKEGVLDTWIADVRAGRTPVLRRNLRYRYG